MNTGSTKDTYFAPGEEATSEQLQAQILAATEHPLSKAILNAFGGIVLILNEQRQAIAVNASLMERLGFEDPHSLLGLRMGAVLNCVHEPVAPSGCGTGKACATCGGAISILASQKTRRPVERECLLLTEHGGEQTALEFRARACPLEHDGQHYTVLTLQDIQAEKKWETLNSVFFHDVMNIMTGLCGSIDLAVAVEEPAEAYAHMREAQRATEYLIDETRTHQEMCSLDGQDYPVDLKKVSIHAIVGTLHDVFNSGALLDRKTLHFEGEVGAIQLLTDPLLVQRVLVNMVKNALEATPSGGKVRISSSCTPDEVKFEVWNAQSITAGVAPRIFQRYFSTKNGVGRGLGTFAMKLFGEEVLGGRVSFTSSPEEGTVFILELPRSKPSSEAPRM